MHAFRASSRHFRGRHSSSPRTHFQHLPKGTFEGAPAPPGAPPAGRRCCGPARERCPRPLPRPCCPPPAPRTRTAAGTTAARRSLWRGTCPTVRCPTTSRMTSCVPQNRFVSVQFGIPMKLAHWSSMQPCAQVTGWGTLWQSHVFLLSLLMQKRSEKAERRRTAAVGTEQRVPVQQLQAHEGRKDGRRGNRHVRIPVGCRVRSLPAFKYYMSPTLYCNHGTPR